MQAWATINEYRDTEKELKDELEKLREEVSELNDRLNDAATAPDMDDEIGDLRDEKAALQVCS